MRKQKGRARQRGCLFRRLDEQEVERDELLGDVLGDGPDHGVREEHEGEALADVLRVRVQDVAVEAEKGADDINVVCRRGA